MRRARVHQNGYVFRKGNFWYVRYYDRSIQPDGTEVKLQKCRQLVEFCGIYRTKTAVRVLADEFLAPFNNGKMKPASTMSLTDFIEGRYLPFVKSHKEASTYAGYKNMFTRYLKGRRSNIALRDARTGDIETMLTDIVKEFDPAKTTVQHIKSFLSGVFHYAKRLAILDFENPVRDAVLPKCKELEDTYAYTLEEILATLEVLPEAAAAAVAIAGFAGLREGEIRGARWERYTGTEIRVAKAVWRGYVKDPKSRASKAPVPVIAQLAKRLDDYRRQCGSPDSGWMFPNSTGKPRCLDEMARKVIRPALEKAGIGWHGWHAFRRGLATNLHRLGVPDKVIQTILRHANVSVTQACYIKVVQPDAVEAMAKLEHATEAQLKRAREKAMGAALNVVAAGDKITYATIMQPFNDDVNLAGRQPN